MALAGNSEILWKLYFKLVFDQIKKLSLQSVVYGVGHVMTRLVTFLLLPFYTNVFTVEEYGVISLAYAFIGFALILFRYGMDTALMKFYITDRPEEKYGVFSTIWVLQLFSSVLFALMLIGLSPILSQYIIGESAPSNILRLISIILAMDVLWNLPMLILRTEERPVTFVGLNLVNVFATISFNIYFVVYAELGIVGVFYGNIAASMLMLFFSFPIVLKRLRFKTISKSHLYKILSFGLPFIPAGIFTMVMELADRYLLEWMIGTSAVGIYSAGYKLGMFGLLMVMGFTMGWTPFFLKKGKDKYAPEMFSRITTYFLGLYGFVAVFFTLIIDNLVKINIGSFSFFGETFWAATNIVPIIFLAYFFFGLYVLQLPAVYLPGKTKWIPFFRFCGALTNVVLNILVIPIYGVMGAAFATMGAQAIMALSIFLKSRKDYIIPFRQIGVIFPLFAIIGSMFIDSEIIIKCIYLFGYCILWFFIVADKTEQNYILRKDS